MFDETSPFAAVFPKAKVLLCSNGYMKRYFMQGATILLFASEICLWRQPYYLLGSGLVHPSSGRTVSLFVQLDCKLIH